MEAINEDLQLFRSLPDKIKESELKLLALKNKLSNIINKISTKEAKIMSDICNETIDGKAAFSNEEKRRAEFNIRKSKNDEWVSLDEEKSKIEYDLKVEEIELNNLVNIKTAIKYTLVYLAAVKGDLNA